MGSRLWVARRKVDVVLEHPETGKRLGIECKYQGVGGTAQEKIYATLADLEAWPIPGIVVIDGPGFTPEMKSALVATGKVLKFEDLEEYLRFYFGLPIE